jgi:DNA-binding transcriptional LysR family regulator
MLDRVTGMQVFARVAQLGTLSAAARALGMSQTMATKHIAAIEERLGVKLLHRTTRRLTLTEAGRRYLEAAERIVAEVEDAEASAAADRTDPRGTLRVNAPVSFGAREIAPVLTEFAAAYPAVTVDLGLNDRFVDLIEEGWDVSIRIGALTESTMIARKLAPCDMVICAAPSYLAQYGTPRSVDELVDHNCLSYTLLRALAADRWPLGADGKVIVPIKGNLRANNGDALVAAALAGQGLVYQPAFFVNAELRAGRLVSIELDHPTLQLAGIFAVYPADRRPPAKVRVFIDFLVARFAPVPPWERGIG